MFPNVYYILDLKKSTLYASKAADYTSSSAVNAWVNVKYHAVIIGTFGVLK